MRTTTTADPWSGVADYLKGGYQQASNLYGQGAPSYYPGQTVAPLSGYSQSAIDQQAQRAMQGSPLTTAGQNQLTNTLNGSYLNAGNPYFSGAVNAAIRPVTEQFQNTVIPGINSTFSDAGRFGSGAQQSALNQAGTDYQRNIGDISSNMAYQNYSDERANQLKAGLLAPQMAQQDYFDIGQLGQAGGAIDTQNQNLINADINKYNYNTQAPWNFLSDYIGLLSNAPWGQSTVTPQQRVNPVTSGLGGALSGAALGSAIPGLGTLLGAGIGGGAGLLGSFF